MLVLARRRNEKIVFPHLGVTVEILNIAGNSVRIGVQAPPDIKILRQEVIDRGARVSRAAGHGGRTAPDAGDAEPPAHRRAWRSSWRSRSWPTGSRTRPSGASPRRSRRWPGWTASRLGAAAGRSRPPSGSCGGPCWSRTTPTKRRLLAKYLERSGFRVDVAHDGCDALDYLSSHARPDVVLLDMLMPRCDGPSTIRAIRNNRQFAGMKVFAVSGLPPQDFSVPIGPGGVDQWFPKPLDPEALIDEINRTVPAAAPAAEIMNPRRSLFWLFVAGCVPARGQVATRRIPFPTRPDRSRTRGWPASGGRRTPAARWPTSMSGVPATSCRTASCSSSP